MMVNLECDYMLFQVELLSLDQYKFLSTNNFLLSFQQSRKLHEKCLSKPLTGNVDICRSSLNYLFD